MILKTSLILSLLFLFYQDMRYRAVYWLMFPFLLVLFADLAYVQVEFMSLVNNSGVNLAFLLIQFLILTFYFSLKNRRWINISAGLLGLGDILFLLCIAFYLSPLNYLFFYLISLIVVLLITGVALINHSGAGKKVPLAGLQSLLLAMILVFDWNSPLINLTSDHWLLRALNL